MKSISSKAKKTKIASRPKTKAKPDIAIEKSAATDVRRVLLVEDDPFISKAYAHYIARSGYAVDVALNVIEARKKLAVRRPDIILLDIIMPGINGYEFLEELKKKSAHKDVPVIMISNLSEQSAIARCKRLGAADYLVKSNLFMRDVIDKIQRQIVMGE